MNALARSDLKAAFDLAKTAIGQFNASVSPPPGLGNVAESVEKLCHVIQALDEELEKVKGTARHANNIASCLANGIQPD